MQRAEGSVLPLIAATLRKQGMSFFLKGIPLSLQGTATRQDALQLLQNATFCISQEYEGTKTL